MQAARSSRNIKHLVTWQWLYSDVISTDPLDGGTFCIGLFPDAILPHSNQWTGTVQQEVFSYIKNRETIWRPGIGLLDTFWGVKNNIKYCIEFNIE